MRARVDWGRVVAALLDLGLAVGPGEVELGQRFLDGLGPEGEVAAHLEAVGGLRVFAGRLTPEEQAAAQRLAAFAGAEGLAGLLAYLRGGRNPFPPSLRREAEVALRMLREQGARPPLRA